MNVGDLMSMLMLTNSVKALNTADLNERPHNLFQRQNRTNCADDSVTFSQVWSKS